jgi:hypothetical protein
MIEPEPRRFPSPWSVDDPDTKLGPSVMGPAILLHLDGDAEKAR